MPIADTALVVWEITAGVKTAICAEGAGTFAIAAPGAMTVPRSVRTAWRNAPTVQKARSVRAVIGVSTVQAEKASSA